MNRSLTSNRLTNAISPIELLWLIVVVVAESLLVAGYFTVTPAEPTSLRYIVYPFVWINVGVLAAVKATPTSADRRYRWAAAAVAGAYFLVLAAIAGLVGVPPAHEPNAADGVRVAMLSPGWGPAIVYTASAVQFVFVPYLVIGYLSLAYLVYVTILNAAKTAVSGVLGLASCVGCTFPVIASLVAGLAGGSSALTTAVYALSIDLSTIAFVVAIALLYWQPGVGIYDPR